MKANDLHVARAHCEVEEIVGQALEAYADVPIGLHLIPVQVESDRVTAVVILETVLLPFGGFEGFGEPRNIPLRGHHRCHVIHRLNALALEGIDLWICGDHR